MALDFTFLEHPIWGDEALDVMKRYGRAVAPTDLAAILGGTMDSADGAKTSEGETICASWSASSDVFGRVCCALSEGDGWCGVSATERRISARPALRPSEASKVSPENIHEGPNSTKICEWGEYPQTIANKLISEKLEKLYNSKSLCPTKKSYTFDSVDIDDRDTVFKAKSYQEYEMDGKRYIRVLGRPADDNSKLSNGKQVEAGKPYWVEVQPIEWLVDKSGTMVAKKCLFTGIQFDTKEEYNGDFSKTFMKHYLDTYFAKEMEPPQRLEKAKSRQSLTSLLRSSKKRSATVVREAPKIACPKICRSKNPKTSGR